MTWEELVRELGKKEGIPDECIEAYIEQTPNDMGEEANLEASAVVGYDIACFHITWVGEH